jgi:ribosome recycling factor
MASSIQAFLDDATQRMGKAVEHFALEIRGIRTGRANPGLIENVRVDYYGTKTPLGQMAAISVPEPRQLVVKPYDMSVLKEIERAVLTADLGLNPSIDGKSLRIIIPPLSEEQRKKLAARVKTMAEETKVALRNVRRDVLKHVETALGDKKRSPAVTDDDAETAKEKVQDILKVHEKKVDDAVTSKSKDIMEV